MKNNWFKNSFQAPALTLPHITWASNTEYWCSYCFSCFVEQNCYLCIQFSFTLSG